MGLQGLMDGLFVPGMAEITINGINTHPYIYGVVLLVGLALIFGFKSLGKNKK